ncbi:MAG: DNA topoisomerase, partial [Oscillospiraceae bacterium]|nr:DNA topoisomerase [Oscillospiraceae bacterium]
DARVPRGDDGGGDGASGGGDGSGVGGDVSDAGGAGGAEIPDGDIKLPELTEGEALDYHGIVPDQHFTQPPPRYTEATLIRALEEKGIGRPSTYAPTISTILSRGYIEKEKRSLYPTDLGKAVNDIMTSHFTDIVDVAFTADMEKKLDDVEEGNKEWRSLIHDFYGGFERVLKTAEEEIGEVEIADEVSDVICEKCGRNMVIKMGRYGKFLACPGYPDCKNAKPIVEYAGVECPKCGGNIVYRKTKKGKKYISCESVATCDFRTWDLPANEVCKLCGKFMVRPSWGGKNASLRCSDETCPNGAKPEYKKTEAKADAEADAKAEDKGGAKSDAKAGAKSGAVARRASSTRAAGSASTRATGSRAAKATGSGATRKSSRGKTT